MDVKLALASLLILLAVSNGNGQKKMEMRIEQVHSHHSSHMHHTDPSLIVFFFIDDLKEGNTIPIYFPSRKLEAVSAHMLPKEEADSIPFSSDQLHHLLERYSFPRGSPQATAMEDTLRQCETEPIKGETKTGENGDRVEAVAVCHMDTSQWSPSHIAFKVLGIEPGSSPVCHFFPADNFVSVPSTTLMEA